MEISQEKENPLLNRKEFVFEYMASSKTPTREEVKKLVVEHLKLDEKLTIIESITPSFCDRKVCVKAYVYEDLETLKKITPKHILKRNEGKKEESKEKKNGTA